MRLRCHAILWFRDFSAFIVSQRFSRQSWAFYMIQKRQDIEEMTNSMVFPPAADNCSHKLSIDLVSLPLAATIRSPSCKPAAAAGLGTMTLCTSRPTTSGRPEERRIFLALCAGASDAPIQRAGWWESSEAIGSK